MKLNDRAASACLLQSINNASSAVREESLAKPSQVTPDDVMRSIHALMVFSIQTDGIEQGSGEEQNSVTPRTLCWNTSATPQ